MIRKMGQQRQLWKRKISSIGLCVEYIAICAWRGPIDRTPSFSIKYTRTGYGASAQIRTFPYSGIGSYDPSIKEYVALVKEVIRAYDIQSVIEVGCGDFAVASQYVDACQTYIGVDVVGALIEYNSGKFGRQHINFLWADACKSKLERADLCIVRQVLQHLSNRDISRLLGNIKSKYILVTEHLPSPERTRAYNLDKRSGGDIRVPAGSGVFVDQPPFNLNAKILMERNVVSDIHSADERLVTWLVTT
jgi:hypothetical protein